MTSDEHTAQTPRDLDDLHGYLESEVDLSAEELVQEERGKNAIHKKRLRRLVEKWRTEANVKAEISKGEGPDLWGEVGVLEIKADELERVIEDE